MSKTRSISTASMVRGIQGKASTSKLDQQNSSKGLPSKSDEGKFIQIIGKDYIRSLRIRRNDPPKETILLKSSEFEPILTKSQWFDREKARIAKEASEKEKNKKAAEIRKTQLTEAELYRSSHHVQTDMDIEARDRAQYLMERAATMKMEQEDEIKHFNQIVFGAQCQAIRDDQIQEKKRIQQEMANEQKRLDDMMEVERQRGLDMIDTIEKLRKDQRVKGMQEIHRQIHQRHEDKMIDDELKEMEKAHVREKQQRMRQEDIEALRRKRMEQQLLQKEIMRINDETMQAKERKMEQERLADLKALEYMRKKLEREAEFEEEQNRIKKEKELEIARLLSLQERDKDYKAEQDEIRARRNQEIAEREWRKKEKEKAEKKAQEDEMLRTARQEQINIKMHCQSLKVDEEKALYDRLLNAREESMRRQNEYDEMMHQRALQHGQGIRQQIKDRELAAANRRREMFQEVERMREDEHERRVHLDKLKQKKIQQLKATGIPEIYCAEVERKAQRTIVN